MKTQKGKGKCYDGKRKRIKVGISEKIKISFRKGGPHTRGDADYTVKVTTKHTEEPKDFSLRYSFHGS